MLNKMNFNLILRPISFQPRFIHFNSVLQSLSPSRTRWGGHVPMKYIPMFFVAMVTNPYVTTPICWSYFWPSSGKMSMASEDGVVFCVPEFPSNAFLNLDELRNQEKLCDITLVVGERQVKCHRVVLAAASPYFNAMFTGDMLESRLSEVTIYGVDFFALQELISFCYSGRTEITVENVQNLMCASNLLQLTSVKQACVEFLHRVLHPSNCLGIRSFADTFCCGDLVEAAGVFAMKNFSDVSKSEEFLGLDPDELVALISSDELNVRTEEEVFEAVMYWTQKDEEERRDFLPELLKHVRLPLICPQYICDHIATQELVKKNLACRDLVDEAKDFLLLPERRSTLQSPRTRPRRSSEAAGIIYAIGGLNSSGEALSTVEKFDPITGQWSSAEAMNSLRTRVGVAVLGQNLYALGGFDGHKRLSTVEFYNHQVRKWNLTTPMNTRRSALGAAIINQKIYVVGGYDGHISLSTMECFSPKTNSWSFLAPMKTLRSASGVTEFNGKLFVIGGHNGLSIFSTVEIYDPQTDTWCAGPSMNSRRCRVGVTTLNGCIYVCGGYDGSAFLNTVECYDPSTGEWKYSAPMHSRRSRVAVITLGGRLFAVGGYDGLTNLNTVECYDPHGGKWKFSTPMCKHQGGVGVGVLRRGWSVA